MRPVAIVLALLLIHTGFAQELSSFKLRVPGATVVKYSNSDQYMAINSKNDLIIYPNGSAVERRRFEDFRKPITSIAFDPEDQRVMAASEDKSIRIYNIERSDLEFVINCEEAVMKAEFVDKDKVVYITEKYAALYDLALKQESWRFTDLKRPLRAMAADPGKGLLAIGGGDQIIQLLDLNSGELMNSFEYHSDWIRSLAFHPREDLLASGSDDGIVLIWSLKNDEILSNVADMSRRINALEFSIDGNYLMYAAENLNFYSLERKQITHQADNFIADIISTDISPKGDLVMTVEDLVPTIKSWDISALGISRVFTFRDESDKTPPMIYLSNPANIRNDRITVGSEMIDLRGNVQDESGINSLSINGIETPVRDNGSFVINLPLSPGDNFITMEARDVNANIALKKFVIERRNLDGTEYVSEEARNFLFVVGINDYQHWPKLNNAVKDASDITSTLLSRYQFNFEDVILLKDEQATRANIYSSLRSLIEKVTPKDNLMIYFSGHGYYDDLLNEGYWVPYDAPKGSMSDYLPNSTIFRILENINSQHTFLVADACFSGSLFSGTTRGYVENVEKFRSRWGLASGRLEVVSDGTQGNNSPFATNFLEFLQTNQKDRFPVSELVQYVKFRTAEMTDQTPIGNPLKSLGDEGGEFIFYLKK